MGLQALRRRVVESKERADRAGKHAATVAAEVADLCAKLADVKAEEESLRRELDVCGYVERTDKLLSQRDKARSEQEPACCCQIMRHVDSVCIFKGVTCCSCAQSIAIDVTGFQDVSRKTNLHLHN